MRRREFTGLLLGAIVAQYPAAAQQPGKVLRIGILAPGPLRPIASFKQHLRDLGWIEGSNIRFEDRWAEGDDTRYAEFAVELATLPVDAILTWSTPSVLAAKRATTVIPIVMAAVADPVAIGAVSVSRAQAAISPASRHRISSWKKRGSSCSASWFPD
jgi:putative ABC transport system substrate-binding protein